MATYKVGLSADLKTVYLAVGAGALAAGSTEIGTFDHDESDDPLGNAAENHALFHHVRDILYKTEADDPDSGEVAMFPNGIYDMAGIKILLEWPATNTVAPAVTGTAQVGQVLTTTNGTWVGTPAPTYTRQWYADDVAIPEATATTYTVLVGDLGKIINCVVTATNSAGANSASSNDTAAVIAA